MATQSLGLAQPDPTLSTQYPEFLATLLAGDRRQCETLTEQAVGAGVPILAIYQELYQRALYQVGEDWECNRISVGIEHLATAIIEGLLNRLYPQVIAQRRAGRRIVIGSVEGELHQVGAKMACDVFEMHGWDSLYLGADTPTSELLRTLRELCPDAVGLSLSVNFHVSTMVAAIKAIRAAFPDLPIVIGGQGLREVGRTRMSTLVSDPKVRYAADLDGLELVIAGLG